jgi:hypothetical protein
MPACHYHPDRPGVGVCMRCRVVLCGPCRTRVQGVNHCHACLDALAAGRGDGRGTADPAEWVVRTVVSALAAGMGTLVLFGLCWLVRGSLAP